ncbi:MAG: hypothetical protein K8S94_16040 [Planctomycetia bacterium]|nr:hypothetical protein [Planctomycetia bacterium]
MRLTVRTLLAWIDGVLDADDQKDLGEKVAASGVALRLVERANSAVVHPGLSAPAPEGRGLADDPGTAAEFLDNVLRGEQLQAFERVCIESDMHLAEVAACHRLLAEIMANPALVEPLDAGQRRTLLAAVARHVAVDGQPAGTKARSAVSERLRPPTPPAAPKRAVHTAAPVVSGPPGRPSRRAPLAAWMAAAAALGLLLMLGGFFVWSITRGASRRGPKSTEIAAAPAVSESSPDKPTPQPAARAEPVAVAEPPVEQAPVATAIPEQSSPPAPAAVAAPAEQPVEQPAVVAAASPPSPPPVEDRRVPNGDALAIVAQPMPATAPADRLAAAPPENAPPADAPAIAAAVGNAGLLLHLVAGEKGPRWRPLAAGAALADRENLLAPPWCHPALTINGVTIRLGPDTRAVLTRDPDGTPRLEVVFGRAVVGGEAADAKLGVTAGGLCGVLSGVMRQPAGIEVVLARDPGGEEAAAEPRARATIFAGAAEKVWRQTGVDGAAAEPLAGIPAELLVAPRATLAWDGRDPAAGVVGPPPVDPAWLRATVANDRTARAAAEALAASLAKDPDGEIEAPLRNLTADRRAENRMIAAATLALLGDYDQLVTLLCDESPRGMLNETQWTTLEKMTVPLALARGENAAAKLGEALHARGPAGKGDLLARLARGFTDDELAAGDDALLVGALEDGSLAVRRYAIRRLIEIVQPDARHRMEYRADRSSGSRKDGSGWWKAQLESGRIRREPPPAESAPSAASPPAERDDE